MIHSIESKHKDSIIELSKQKEAMLLSQVDIARQISNIKDQIANDITQLQYIQSQKEIIFANPYSCIQIADDIESKAKQSQLLSAKISENKEEEGLGGPEIHRLKLGKKAKKMLSHSQTLSNINWRDLLPYGS